MAKAILIVIITDLALLVIGLAVGGGALAAAQQDLRGVTSSQLTSRIEALRTKVWIASAGFGVARVCWWPWRLPADALARAVRPARVAGTVGPLLDLAADGSAVGLHALDGLAPVLAAIDHKQQHDGRKTPERLLAGLQQGQGALREARDDLDSVTRDWHSLDTTALPASVRTRLAALPHLLPEASDAIRVALAAPDLLGATHPRIYLLAPQNPWDLRATGGFIGTAPVVTVSHGALKLSSLGSTSVDIGREAYIPPPLPLVAYEHFNNWYYRDANWSPDFPTSAKLLAYFYYLGRHVRPDGVIALDSDILPPLLEITGPVSVSGPRGEPITLRPKDALATIDRYVNYYNGLGHVNKDFAGRAYQAVFKKLQQLPASRLPVALRALGTALAQRHLLIWLPDPAISPILARHGWDGAVNPTRHDYLYVVDTNVQGNKISDRVHERIGYQTVVQPDRSLRSTVTISYDNTTTSAFLKTRPPQNNTLYEDFVRVYVPLGSVLERASGLTQPWTTTRASNKTIFCGYVRVPSRHHVTVRFSYRVPPNALLDASTYRLTIQKQPGTGAFPLSVQVAAGTPSLRVDGGAHWSWHGTRRTDLTLGVPVRGGHARPVPLAYDAAPPRVAPGAAVDPWVVLPANRHGGIE